MTRQLDALFVVPDSSAQAYQGLSKLYAAIEPPTWALLLAESCRSRGFGVAILDANAERLSLDAAERRVSDINPRLVVMVVYGQNPNSGTTSMIGALALATAIKQISPQIPLCFVGSHISALPMEVLSHDCVDIALLNEGVYALHNLLLSNLGDDLTGIQGIGYKRRMTGEEPVPVLNPPEDIVPQQRMDQDLPGYAWDLLPCREKPLDLYRSHVWHTGYDHESRTPYAAIYTSLGCTFACDFCMINIINRTDNGSDVSAADSRGIRYWSTEWIGREMRKLADLGVRTLRISDEMFFLNRAHYQPLLQQVIETELDFRMWAYARIDSVREDSLDLFRNAGVDWLAVGIEAGNQQVRQEVSKGSFQEVDIRDVCERIRDTGINVIGNYIVGFPDDDMRTMQETLDLMLELNTETANLYPCQALPGSPLYNEARRNGWRLPDSFEGFGFLSYECLPLPTKHVSAEAVLKFRDQAWQTYFTNPAYLSLVENKFGSQARQNVEDMAAIPLKRKILGD